ncbi:MAG TPA: MBL fold metallo-hydrolase [Candidatus Limnocylindrales bacterium]
MEIRQFDLPGLGHLSALLVDETSGRAAVIDPRRDVDIYLEAVARRGLRIGHVLETHLHNDYVSGARELAALTGARHVIGAGADLGTDCLPVRDGQTIDVGRLHVTALETPGHTPEHVSYAVRNAGTGAGAGPEAIFTGGSMLVGSVGRTDLLGAEHARPYALDMHRSLHQALLRQPDETGILPTHGAGSLCSRGIGEAWSSTVGIERATDPLLAIEDPDAFADALLAGQPAYPRYFARMRSLNRAGPRMLGAIPEPQPLDVPAVRDRLAGGAQLIDLRRAAAFAAAYVPGSVSLPADASFGTWLGWVVEPDRPLVLLLPQPAAWDDAVRQALRVGYDTIVGYLDGGLEAWHAAGGQVAAGQARTVLELAAAMQGSEPPLVLDVRQADEYASAHVPGSQHLMAGDLPDRLAELPRDRAIATICASGYRSSVAASLLRQAGFQDVAWVEGGVPTWQAAGLPVEIG